jgi:heat shock protein HslJ
MKSNWGMFFVLLCFASVVLTACSKLQGNPLLGQEWTLISLKGHDVISIPGREITATFKRGEIVGFTGCNRYSIDEVEVNKDSLVFKHHYAARTDLLCKTLEGFELTEQENEYLTTFVSATAYSISDGQLELKNEYGDVVLIFQK